LLFLEGRSAIQFNLIHIWLNTFPPLTKAHYAVRGLRGIQPHPADPPMFRSTHYRKRCKRLRAPTRHRKPMQDPSKEKKVTGSLKRELQYKAYSELILIRRPNTHKTAPRCPIRNECSVRQEEQIARQCLSISHLLLRTIYQLTVAQIT